MCRTEVPSFLVPAGWLGELSFLATVRILHGQEKQHDAREMRFPRSRHAVVAGDDEEGAPYVQHSVDLSPILKRTSSTKV